MREQHDDASQDELHVTAQRLVVGRIPPSRGGHLRAEYQQHNLAEEAGNGESGSEAAVGDGLQHHVNKQGMDFGGTEVQ